MPIINFGELEKPIKEVERILKEYNVEEKQLIMKSLQGRLTTQIQNLRAQEVSDNVLKKIPLGVLAQD